MIPKFWFLANNLDSFVSIPWKHNNLYCHIEINTYFNVFNAISSSSFSLYLLSLIRHKKYLAQNSICCFRINWLRPDVGLVKKWVANSRPSFFKILLISPIFNKIKATLLHISKTKSQEVQLNFKVCHKGVCAACFLLSKPKI